ncbi:MAG: hypothetical protein KAY65_04740 [Planctomycetes bacterium]|nr:hypothetical protein [Planctomycetota bacterium]
MRLALLVVTVLLGVGVAGAEIIINVDTTIDSPVGELVRIVDGRMPPTVVNINADVYDVQVLGYSVVNWTGGDLGGFSTDDNSTAYISGGRITDALDDPLIDVTGNSTVYITGGNVHSVEVYDSGTAYIQGNGVRYLLALDDSTVHVTGGEDLRDISLGPYGPPSTCEVYVYGTNFNYAYGAITDASGILTGTLQSGDLLNANFDIAAGTSIILAPPKYGGASGTPEDPYQIWDANDMQAIGADHNNRDKCFKLMADIDLGQFDGKDGRPNFNIIGKFITHPYTEYHPFTGVFDGNGHEISNFTYSSTLENDVGIFGYVSGEGALIRNVGLRDTHITIERGYYTGSLVGQITDGAIIGCYAVGGSIAGWSDVGGLVGRNSGGTISHCFADVAVSCAPSDGRDMGGLLGATVGGDITECYARGNVSARSAAGGLIGLVAGEGAIIHDCYATGNVSGSHDLSINNDGLVGKLVRGNISKSHSSGDVSGYENVGGLVGHVACSDGSVVDCYSTGNVTGSENIGGLVGTNISLIMNCYSTGNVSGTDTVGGLVGLNKNNRLYSGMISNSYWDAQSSDEPNMCGLQGENATGCDPNYGKTTAEMMQQSTFQDWDFINVWNIGENQTYPYLRTVLAGDINKDAIVNFLDLCIVAEQWMNEPD